MSSLHFGNLAVTTRALSCPTISFCVAVGYSRGTAHRGISIVLSGSTLLRATGSPFPRKWSAPTTTTAPPPPAGPSGPLTPQQVYSSMSSAPSGLSASMNAYCTQSGIDCGAWKALALVDPGDPTWAAYNIAPDFTKENPGPGAVGFAHLVGSSWQLLAGGESLNCASQTGMPDSVKSYFGVLGLTCNY